jgi:hypothetical protein
MVTLSFLIYSSSTISLELVYVVMMLPCPYSTVFHHKMHGVIIFLSLNILFLFPLSGIIPNCAYQLNGQVRYYVLFNIHLNALNYLLHL